MLDDLFKNVVEKVEALYSGWYLSGLAENWTNVSGEDLEKHGYIQEINRQEQFYSNNIKRCDSRVFVIISDALRYEVAASLAEQLRRETQSKVDLGSMCSIFPSITPFGMAALLPHNKLTVGEKTTGGLTVLADGQPTDSLNRDKVLKSTNVNSVALQYKNIIGMKKADRQPLVKGMDVVYIYHDKIDEASHTSDNSVFPACEDLSVQRDEKGYYLYVSANEYCCPEYGVRLYNALKSENVPITFYNGGTISKYLNGEGKVGIVPCFDSPSDYFYGGFADKDVGEFINLPDEKYNDLIHKAQWEPLVEVRLKGKDM